MGGNTVSWRSVKQKSVALSSMEAEYMSLAEATKEALWLKALMRELIYDQKTVKIYEDNQSCIALAKNPERHSRAKHIDIKYHFVRELVEDKQIAMVYTSTKKQLGDMFIKPIPRNQFEILRDGIGLKEVKND